jgi:hypothetical protein
MPAVASSVNPPNFSLGPQLLAAQIAQAQAQAAQAQAQAQAQSRPLGNPLLPPQLQPAIVNPGQSYRPQPNMPVNAQPFVPGSKFPQNPQFPAPSQGNPSSAPPSSVTRPIDGNTANAPPPGQFPPKRPLRTRPREHALLITEEDGTPIKIEGLHSQSSTNTSNAPEKSTSDESTSAIAGTGTASSSPSISSLPAPSIPLPLDSTLSPSLLTTSTGDIIDTSARPKQILEIISPTKANDQTSQPTQQQIPSSSPSLSSSVPSILPPDSELSPPPSTPSVTAAMTAQPVISQKKPLLTLSPQPNSTSGTAVSDSQAAHSQPQSSSPRSSLSHSLSGEFSTPLPDGKKPIKVLERSSQSSSPIIATLNAPVQEFQQLTLDSDNTQSNSSLSNPPSVSLPLAADSSPLSPSLSASSSSLDLAPPKPVLPPLSADGRMKYDRSFLLTFSSIVQKPANFPPEIAKEILADLKNTSQRSGNRANEGGKNWNSQRNRQFNGQGRTGNPQTPRSGPGSSSQNSPSSQGQKKRQQQSSNTITPLTRVTAVKGPIDNRRGVSSQTLSLLPAVAPLAKTENAWQPGKAVETEMDKVRKKCLSLLNKLTREKFETISAQLIDLIKANVRLGHDLLREVVTIMFDKALAEPFFASMYSDFCVRINDNVKEFEEPVMITETTAKRKRLFKTLLLNKCQEEFERGVENVQTDGKTEEEVDEEKSSQKRRMLGNIRFIGELFKKSMLTEPIMHSCVHHLLLDSSNPTEEDIEALCNLLTTIGKNLDHESANHKMEAYFDKLIEHSQNKKFPSRIRFMILDLLDLRKNGWIPRAKTVEAKTIEQVRKESEAELLAKRNLVQVQKISLIGKPGTMMPAAGGSRVVTQDIRILSNKTPIVQPQPQLITPITQAGAGPGALKDRQMRPPQGLLRPQGGFNQRFEPTGQTISIKPSGIDLPTNRSSPSPNSPSPTRQSPSPAPLDVDSISKAIKSCIVEYSLNCELTEVQMTLEEISTPDGAYLLVSEVIELIFDKRDTMNNLTKLCIELFKLDTLQTSDFIKGIQRATRNWDERLEDAPKAQEWLAAILALWISSETAAFKTNSLAPALAEISKYDPSRVAEILFFLFNTLTSREFGWSDDRIRTAFSLSDFRTIVGDATEADRYLQSKPALSKYLP